MNSESLTPALQLRIENVSTGRVKPGPGNCFTVFFRICLTAASVDGNSITGTAGREPQTQWALFNDSAKAVVMGVGPIPQYRDSISYCALLLNGKGAVAACGRGTVTFAFQWGYLHDYQCLGLTHITAENETNWMQAKKKFQLKMAWWWWWWCVKTKKAHFANLFFFSEKNKPI